MSIKSTERRISTFIRPNSKLMSFFWLLNSSKIRPDRKARGLKIFKRKLKGWDLLNNSWRKYSQKHCIHIKNTPRKSIKNNKSELIANRKKFKRFLSFLKNPSTKQTRSNKFYRNKISNSIVWEKKWPNNQTP